MSLAIVSNDVRYADGIGKRILEYSMKNGCYTDVISFSCLSDFYEKSQKRTFSTLLYAADEVKALNALDEVKERLPDIKLAVVAGTSAVAAGCFTKNVDFCAEAWLDEASIKRIVDLCFS